MNQNDFDLLVTVLKGKKNEIDPEIENASIIKASKAGKLAKVTQQTIGAKQAKPRKQEISNYIENKKDHIEQSKAEVIRTGDRIDQIIVYCQCGEVHKIDFKY